MIENISTAKIKAPAILMPSGFSKMMATVVYRNTAVAAK